MGGIGLQGMAYGDEKMKKHGTKKTNQHAVIRGSGNVFKDLGFTSRDAAELDVRAELTRQIRNRIASMGLTQNLAAERLRISQPDISKLMNGRHSSISVERLISILNVLGLNIDIIVRHKNPARD